MALRALTDEDLSLYAEQMTRIKYRIDHASAFLSPPITYPRVEAGLLQVRQALEAIMVSSLITNRSAIEQATAAIVDRNRRHREVYKLVRKLNPDFWPKPVSNRWDEAHTTVLAFEYVEDGFLREEDYLRTWGQLSEWLHARSPFRLMPDPHPAVELGSATVSKLRVLLNQHYVTLLDRSQSISCIMHAASDGRVHVTSWDKIDPM